MNAWYASSCSFFYFSAAKEDWIKRFAIQPATQPFSAAFSSYSYVGVCITMACYLSLARFKGNVTNLVVVTKKAKRT